MIFVAASIFDSKGKFFSAPFFVHNKAVAQRAFADIANNKEHSIGKNPGDYILFIIGLFNDETAELTYNPVPENCGIGSQFIRE